MRKDSLRVGYRGGRIPSRDNFHKYFSKNWRTLEIVNTRFDVRRVVKETQNLIRGLLDENSI